MNVKYLHLDTETTGLDDQRDEIWQISYCIDDYYRHERAYIDRTFFVEHTAMPSDFTLKSAEYQRVFVQKRLQMDDLIMPPRDIARLMMQDIGFFTQDEQPASVHLVGANPSFDDSFLSQWVRRFDIDKSRWYDYHKICVENLALMFMGLSTLGKPPRLKDISELLGFGALERTPHDAKQDRDLARNFFWEMYRRDLRARAA